MLLKYSQKRRVACSQITHFTTVRNHPVETERMRETANKNNRGTPPLSSVSISSHTLHITDIVKKSYQGNFFQLNLKVSLHWNYELTLWKPVKRFFFHWRMFLFKNTTLKEQKVNALKIKNKAKNCCLILNLLTEWWVSERKFAFQKDHYKCHKCRLR